MRSSSIGFSFVVVWWVAIAAAPGYPPEWWTPVDPQSAAEWEILPQQAEPGEVILSKRTELGVFSNFAATAFIINHQTFASVEGFWQMMKYPDAELIPDPRKKETWKITRDEVGQLTGFAAKSAGNDGSAVMQELNINWVSYLGKKMDYRVDVRGEHYKIIRLAMEEKLKQTPGLRDLLRRTGNLILRPDHDQGPTPPPAWRYNEIWMELREGSSPTMH